MHIHQHDVETTFINGMLKEDICMEQLEGYVQQGNKHMVCMLQK